MLATRKRVEQRTRTVQIDGQEWRVQELADGGNDQSEKRTLVFSAADAMYHVQNYHWLWFGFTDDELVALCRSRGILASQPVPA